MFESSLYCLKMLIYVVFKFKIINNFIKDYLICVLYIVKLMLLKILNY